MHAGREVGQADGGPGWRPGERCRVVSNTGGFLKTLDFGPRWDLGARERMRRVMYHSNGFDVAQIGRRVPVLCGQRPICESKRGWDFACLDGNTVKRAIRGGDVGGQELKT